MVLLGILTGMRVGELLGLRRKDVDSSPGRSESNRRIIAACSDHPRRKAANDHFPFPEDSSAPLARVCGHLARTEDETWYFNPVMASHSAIRISCTGI